MGVRLLAALVLLLCAATGLNAQQRLTVAAPDQRSDEIAAGVAALSAALGPDSGITLDIVSGPAACAGGADCIPVLSDGAVDLLVVRAGALAPRVPLLAGLELPYVIDPADAGLTALATDGAAIRLLRSHVARLSEDRITLLGIGPAGGWRHIATTFRRVADPADIAGLRLSPGPGSSAVAFLHALGAEPAPAARPELFALLQFGEIDGVTERLEDLVELGHLGAGLAFVTLDAHGFDPALWLGNTAALDRLTPAQRAALTAAIEAARQAAIEAGQRNAARAEAHVQDKGGDVFRPDAETRAAFRRAILPLYRDFAASRPDGDRLLDALSVVGASAAR